MDANTPLQNVALDSATLGALVPKLNRRLDRDIMDVDAMLVGAALGGDAALGALEREWGATNFDGMRRGAQCDQAALNALGREWGPTDLNLMVWTAPSGRHAALGREWGTTDLNLMVWTAPSGRHAALAREGAGAANIDGTL